MFMVFLRSFRGCILTVLFVCAAGAQFGCGGGAEPAPAPADPENDPNIEAAMEGTLEPEGAAGGDGLVPPT